MKSYDCAVVGAGCAGIFAFHRLSRLGLKVILIEEREGVAAGPSIRNGAYIHAGGYHAATLADRDEAARTAQACMAGADYFAREFPEAVIRSGIPVHLLLADSARRDEVLRRLEDCGVWHRPATSSVLRERYPMLDLSKVALGVEVRDFHVNFRMIFQRLLVESRSWGGEIRVSTSLLYDGNGTVTLVSASGAAERVRVGRIVYCTGAQTPDLVQRNSDRFRERPDVRLWRSHVLNIPPVPGTGFMYLDPGMASVTPQGTHTVICQAKEESPLPVAAYDADATQLKGIERALFDVMPALAEKNLEIRGHSCIKVSLSRDGRFGRNVEYSLTKVTSTEWVALPGKASCAPVLADAVAAAVFGEDDAKLVTRRPGAGLVERQANALA